MNEENPRAAAEDAMNLVDKDIAKASEGVWIIEEFMADYRDALLEALPNSYKGSVWAAFSSRCLTMTNMTYAEVRTVAQACRVKTLEKLALHNGTFRYQGHPRRYPEILLEFWGCGIPPTCKLIREEIEVPAMPAHTETKIRVECKGGHNEDKTEIDIDSPVVTEPDGVAGEDDHPTPADLPVGDGDQE